ncbi:unnamed protein product, partial [Prorocentrum cordatum]
VDLDAFATMAYVQTLQCKIDSMESAIKESINSTVSTAVCDATGPITAALQAAQAGINGLSGKIEKDINLAVGQRIDATRKEFQQQLDIFNARVGELESRHDKTDAYIAAMAVQIRELQQALEVANKQRAQNVLDSLRDRNGNWTRIHAPAVAGRGQVELRVGPDKSPKQIKIEITGKRIRLALERDFPSHNWRVDRVKGWVLAGWAPVISFSVRPGRDEPPVLSYQDTGLPALGIDRTQLKASASAAVAPEAAPQFWLWRDRGQFEEILLRTLTELGRRVTEKTAYLQTLPFSKMILGIQEVHQDHAQLRAVMKNINSTLDMHSSFTPGHHGMISGGVAAVFPAGLHAESEALLLGRVLRTSFRTNDQQLIFYNIHNYEIINAAIKRISTRILSDQHLARTDPSKVILFVMGDFNFAAVGKLKLTEPESRANAEASESPKASARKWHGALRHLVEIEGTDTTHYCAETKSESTIDRCFCSITPTQMLQLTVNSTTFSTPEATDMNHLSPPSKLILTTELLCEIAREARGHMLETSPNRGEVQLQIAKSIARAVWRQGRKLAARLLRVHQAAQDHLALIGEQVKLIDPVKFEEWASNLFRQDADQRQAAINHATLRGRLRPAQARAQSRALQRKIKLWSPISKRLVLTGGAKTSVGTVMGPKNRLQRLVEHWQPVFEGKQIDLEKAADYLSQFSPKINFNNFNPPDYETIKQFASRSSPTSRGMDGHPYTAWAAREKCTETLWEDSEHSGCHRDPSKVRVLGLRDTSMKIISSTMDAATATVAAEVVPASQRGFIHRRNFGYNVLELDVESRIASAGPNAMDVLPVLVSLDIAQAFPSFAHQFICLALKAMGAPEAILNFFDSMYHNLLAMAPCAGQCIPLFYVRSGIIQGCGWSGTLYAMGTASFLLNLEMVLEGQGRGLCRACADDLGLLLKAAAHFAHLAGAIILMDVLAGLTLKAPKCHIIPLAGEVNAELILKLRNALIAIVPRFKDFNICDRLTYLGLLLGPGATEKLIFEKAFNKFKWRTKMFSASDAPSMGSAALFNSRAIPVLGYLAQFAMLPHEYFKNENRINASVLRFPSGAFRIKDWPHLRARGARAPRSLQLAMVVTIVRSATTTFSKFPEIRERLHEGLDAYGIQQTLMGAARGALRRSPPWWQMPSFVEMLHQVATTSTEHAYYPSDMLRPAVAGALEAIHDAR